MKLYESANNLLPETISEPLQMQLGFQKTINWLICVYLCVGTCGGFSSRKSKLLAK